MRTELSFLPKELAVDVWPFSVDRSKTDLLLPNGVYVHAYTAPSLGLKIRCAFNGVRTFIKTGEIRAAVAKPNPLRNAIKTLKFAFVSEIRLASILKWIKETDAVSEDTAIYSYWMYEVAYIAAKLKERYPAAKFITRCHGYDLYEQRHRNGYIPFRKFIIEQADMVCPVSENGKAYLHDLYGEEIERKISVDRLGTVRKAEIPVSQIKEDAIVLVSCSNLVNVKRVHLIISALMNCHKNVHWYHFGDGGLRERLEEQAKSLPENVEYSFMGYQANEDVQRFYANHYIDAFINVSQSEGIPVSVMEAESYGIPIIATNVGGTSEIVHDRENGVLLDVNFTEIDLLGAMDDVVEQAKQYRSNALHTWETMSDAHIVFPKFYMKLAEV